MLRIDLGLHDLCMQVKHSATGLFPPVVVPIFVVHDTEYLKLLHYWLSLGAVSSVSLRASLLVIMACID